MSISVSRQLNYVFAEKLEHWNRHAEMVLAGMRDLPNHALCAVWIADELRGLSATYIALSALQEAGAQDANGEKELP
jgi:hypothetical protein